MRKSPHLSLETTSFILSQYLPQILLVCLAAATAAAPQFFTGNRYWNPSGRHIAILSDTREHLGGGRFRYAYRTENGIDVQATGTPGRAGQSNIRGSYRYDNSLIMMRPQ